MIVIVAPLPELFKVNSLAAVPVSVTAAELVLLRTSVPSVTGSSRVTVIGELDGALITAPAAARLGVPPDQLPPLLQLPLPLSQLLGPPTEYCTSSRPVALTTTW